MIVVLSPDKFCSHTNPNQEKSSEIFNQLEYNFSVHRADRLVLVVVDNNIICSLSGIQISNNYKHLVMLINCSKDYNTVRVL